MEAYKETGETITQQMADDVDKDLGEVKLLICVRAACSVALRKLPQCKGHRSNSATLRECKRLIQHKGISKLHHCDAGSSCQGVSLYRFALGCPE